MKPSANVSWRLRADVASADIEARLAPHFGVEWRDGAAASTTYFDDADAALWHAGYLLSATDGRTMCLTRDGAFVAEARIEAGAEAGTEAATRRGATFWWDFPEGALRDALRPLTGVRALLPIAVHDVAERELVLVNDDRKIVVRASVTRSTVEGGSVHYLTFKPLRGYDAEALDAFRRLGPLFDAEAEPGIRAMLARHRIPVLAPRPGVAVPVGPDMPTEQAVRVMGHAMLADAQRHLDGIVADIDTEFLHAFRVGLRKTRSLVSLLKPALPPATLARLRPRLSAMAGRTNRLRDLDVYLLAQHAYLALLPPDFETGMAELAALVRMQRAQSQRDVAAYLASSAFQGDVDACLAELSLPPALASAFAARPVLPLVKRQMLKRYAALQAMSGRLHAGSADDDIHMVRIEFKKLRYLIEFFLDMLPGKRTRRLLGDFKKIQGVLGEFNDLSVQIDFLGTFQDPKRVAMTKALTGLTAVLHLKKVAARDRIFAALEDYFTETRAIEFDLVFGKRHAKETT